MTELRDSYQSYFYQHPSGCLCGNCIRGGELSDEKEDDRTNRRGAIRHRPADARFDGPSY